MKSLLVAGRAPAAGTLVAEIVPVRALDGDTREAMWRLYEAHYERTERPRFMADLDEKDDVIVVRDAADRAVQGFTTLKSYPFPIPDGGGREARVVFSGDTIIAPAYQGQTALQRAFVRYVMGVVLRHPRMPVYWFLISKGYKTYLLMSRNFLAYWPRHDRPTPPPAQALLHALAAARFGRDYHPALGIVRFEPPGPRLLAWVAPIEPQALEQPDVRFFLSANPGWADGDELCCVGRVDLAMGLNYLRRLARRVARGLVGRR